MTNKSNTSSSSSNSSISRRCGTSKNGPKVHSVPLHLATQELCTQKGIGSVFHGPLEEQECPVTKWPQPDWRKVEDGVSGGHTQGDFTNKWQGGSHYSCNSGVANGDYCFAFAKESLAYRNKRGQEIKSTSATNVPSFSFCCTEINYHACGS